MLKISLYQKICVFLYKHIKTHRYRKNQSYTTDRPATSVTGRGLSPRQEPRIPHALSRSTSEIYWSDLGTDWYPDQNDPYFINSWVKHFETEGIKGLETRPS